MAKVLTITLLLGAAAVAPAVALAGGHHGAGAPPANARPGQCFGQVALPGHDLVNRQRVLVRPAVSEQRWVPAVKRWITKQELVKPGWTETIHHAAVYRTDVSYTLEAGPRRTVRTAPKYRRVVERVLVVPAHLEWRRGRGGVGYGGEPGAQTLLPTGEVMCRVRVPARYETRVRLVKIDDGCTCEVEGPPIRRRVLKQVLVTPARDEQRAHAAVYKTVRTCEIVQPGHAVTVTRPAEYRTVTHVRRIERQGWSQVVCPNGLAPWAMAKMQGALNAQGFDAGPADGVARPQTMEALRRFQHAHHMAEGQVTRESAQALGVID